MKKHILAIAVASALPAIAVAQNVTISGAIDTGIQSYDSGTDTYLKSFDHGLTTSRLVFSGSEDLGGGLKASFTLDMRVNPSVGTQSGTTGSAFNRGAFVGLSGGFGTIQLGQNDTTINQDIDAKVSQMGNLGLSAAIGAGADAPTATNAEMGSDVGNVVRYISPKINGFQLEVGFQSGNASSAESDGKTDTLDIAASYEDGPLGVYVGRGKTDVTTAGSPRTSTAVGAKYDFGMFSVGAFTRKAEMNGYGDLTINQITAKMPLGDGLSLHGLYATGKISSITNGKGSGFSLAATKALSKRTTVYAVFAEVDAKAGAVFTIPTINTGTSAAAVGVDPKAITLGISHSF